VRRTKWLQETSPMRWEEAHEGWICKRLTQEEAGGIVNNSQGVLYPSERGSNS